MGSFAGSLLDLAFLALFCLCQREDTCETLEGKCLRIAAIIPAREGSKGIRHKNLSILGNETLLSRTLRIVRESDKFDSVWVLTDGEAIANEGQRRGGKIHWRDPRTATDNASTVSAVEDFLLKRKEYDVIAVMQCTSPFLQVNFLRKALNIMLESRADCVFSVTRSFQLRWSEHDGLHLFNYRSDWHFKNPEKFIRLHFDGFVFPLNFNPKKRPRRQDWKGELVENGMFYFIKPALVLREKLLQNDRCKTVEIPKQYSLEIDTETDLQLAKTMLPLIENHSRIEY